MIALYEHDCGECIYLGAFDGTDLYYHPTRLTSVIARYSDEPSDYTSGLVFSREGHPGIPELVEARLRAERLGLL